MADLKELKDKLEKGVMNVFSSENFLSYLRFSAAFHSYSINNRILIFLQRPNATNVAGFATWKKLGRSVKKGEKGIMIYSPCPYKKTIEDENGDETELTYTRFKPAYVFDVSQTEGGPLPELCAELEAEVTNYEDLFEAIRKISPVPISFEDIKSGAKGYYHRTDKRIAIQEGMSQLQTIKTALHELTHATLHTETAMKNDKERIETEAEGTAYLTCALLGLETDDYSFEYLASWASSASCEVLKASIDLISETAASFAAKIQEIQKEKAAEVA